MRLSHIKIHGFKSFVDPTTIAFPSNRVGVVGPNGCGKSNVIDAVRWVMGESSAKTLRGASMSDVIFNGSRSRPPAEYAEVELLFSEAVLPQYPDMDEIAIKRRLTKTNQSTYFLNGVRCRRKDVTGVFLGTGLGARSYAIIEQGMISRFIEAKPDDLRVFIEEAAGISRYKEKRRETELRLQHTTENMARLADLQFELDKAIEKLRRQVRAAERYKQLKAAESLLQGQLLSMRWRDYSLAVEKQDGIIQNEDTVQASLQTQLAETAAQYQHSREAQAESNLEYNAVQATYYTHKAEIERLLQNISHSKERQEQLDWDLQQTDHNLLETQGMLAADNTQHAHLEAERQQAKNALEDLAFETQTAEETLAESQEIASESEMTWENFNQRIAQPSEQIQVERARIQNLDRSLQDNQSRLLRLESENNELDLQRVETELSVLNEEMLALEATLELTQAELDDAQDLIHIQRQDNESNSHTIHQTQSQLQQSQGRLASLQALQEAALGKNDEDVQAWLAERGVDADTPRLAQQLVVETGWERAVETVLGGYLEGLCIEDLPAMAAQLDSLPQGQVNLIDRQWHNPAITPHRIKADALGDKVQAGWGLDTLLGGIYVAPNLAEALNLRGQLAAHESIITAQGLWLGANWLRITEDVDQRAGIFAREQDINRLNQSVDDDTQALNQLEQDLEQGKSTLSHAEQQRESLQQSFNSSQQSLAQIRATHGGQAARLEQMGLRARQLLSEHHELTETLSEDAMAREAAEESLINAEALLENLTIEKSSLSQQREASRLQVEQSRQHWQIVRDQQQNTLAQMQTTQTELSRLKQAIARLQIQQEDLADKKVTLSDNLQREQPIDEWQAEHQIALEKQAELELELHAAKEKTTHLDDELRQLEATQRRLESELGHIRSTLEQIKIEHQTNLVRRQTVEEQLQEADYDVRALLEELPPEATEPVWLEGIEDVERKILRLGSINLAALEEYEGESERHATMIAQYDDLQQAMDMLKKAMLDIDNETRQVMTDTLQSINENFQSMFPRLFGGGQASMRLTGEDILVSGVSVMAQPPGKRNSTIHLLSGGEKALTAVALVFSIFQLNPAPFCMLDEVDAPLDDTNVGRFSKLVKEMSEHVQFIFISHNKIAMEIADQLIGVTMQEPGVSRPVAVDLDLAVEMSAI